GKRADRGNTVRTCKPHSIEAGQRDHQCDEQACSRRFQNAPEFGRYLGKHPTVKEITRSFNNLAEELEKTEILRSDFINNFAHEFKTPIVSIAGFAKLLKHGNLTEEQKAEYIDII